MLPRAQVYPLPAESWVRVTPASGVRAVVTASGTSLEVVVPLPSCPSSLPPQQ